MFLSLLACRNLFGSVTNNYLCKGHTHEDVDAVFGLVLSKVIKPYKFSTPAELVTQLQLNLIPHLAAKGESCSCELLLFAYITAVVKNQRTVKKSPKAPPLIHFFDPLTT